MRRAVTGLALCVLGCGEIKGFSNEALPVAGVQVALTGDLINGLTPDTQLYVALVWGTPVVPDPFCVAALAEPFSDPQVRAVVAAGCVADPYIMSPSDVAAVMPVPRPVEVDASFLLLVYDVPETNDGFDPIHFGSLVVFEDLDGSGTLELHSYHESRVLPRDRVLGASVAPRDGALTAVVFRDPAASQVTDPCTGGGCLVGDCPLPPAFSRLSLVDPSSLIPDELPPPPNCSSSSLSETLTFVALTGDTALSELRCTSRGGEAIPAAYTAEPRELEDGTWACLDEAHLVLADPASAPCRRVRQYYLRGCYDDPYCGEPDIDDRDNPPPWWPCARDLP